MKQLRHIAIGLLALSLTLGTGQQACASVQGSTAAGVVDGMASQHAIDHHDHHMVSAEDGLHAARSLDRAHHDGADHACAKCCAACMLGSAALFAPAWTVAQTASRRTLPSSQPQLRGHIVFVDPDIPKLVA